MKVINADHNDSVEIPGAGLVCRPVNIDRTKSGFTRLRSLRIYRFEAGSAIDGHAEEDEVFVVLLSGAIDLRLSDDDAGSNACLFSCKAPTVAYMPPGSAYHLVARDQADVAYARATPTTGPPYKVFTPSVNLSAEGSNVLFDESNYAVHLRLRLLQISTGNGTLIFNPVQISEASDEALLHVRTVPPQRAATLLKSNTDPIALNSWDTVAIAPRDQPSLEIAQGSSLLVLIVFATSSES